LAASDTDWAELKGNRFHSRELPWNLSLPGFGEEFDAP